MELPQLQQYAELHKNDPYIVTLALSIANQKKQMKTGQDGQAGMMPQPKVVDEQIDQMVTPSPEQMMPQQMAQAMPEDQGIGALPAQNMQNFAGGGIVAFGGGGDVPRYQSGTLVGQGLRRDQMLPVPKSNRNAAIASTMADISALSNQEELAKIEAQIQAMPPGPQREYLENRKRILLGRTAPPAAPAPAAAAPVPYDPATATRRSMFVDPPTDKRRSPAASAGPSDASAAPVAAAAVPAIAPTTFQRTTIPDIDVAKQLELYQSSMPREIVDPLAAQREEANAPLIQAAGRQVSLFEQEVQNRKPAFEERLKKLDEKEARVNTMENRNLNMSLIEAGLAMMSGESQHAFVNIGKGAQVGLKSYTEGLAKVEAARDKVDEAKARIEEFRRNEDMMTSKERRSVLRDYDATVAAAKKDMFSGIEKMYGIKRDEITKAIADANARNSVKAEIESRENVGIAGLESSRNIAMANMANQANISAADNLSRERVARMPSQLERILRDPVLREAYTESQLGPANLRRETALRREYYDNPSLATKYPTVEAYLLASGVGGQLGTGDGTRVLGSRPAP
jgi:hypothetical protein